MEYLWIVIGAIVAIAAVGLPVAAIVLVSLASLREESAHSLGGQAPGAAERAARRLLGFRTERPSAPGRRPARKDMRYPGPARKDMRYPGPTRKDVPARVGTLAPGPTRIGTLAPRATRIGTLAPRSARIGAPAPRPTRIGALTPGPRA